MPEVADLYARVRAQVDDAVRNLNLVQRELQDTARSGTEAGQDIDRGMRGAEGGAARFAGSITDLRQGILLLTGAARQLRQATEVAFDFTREGASLGQLAEVAARAGLDVDQLNNIMRGTATDAELARGGLMLMAGTTGETRERMADLVPEIFELTKQLSSVDSRGRSAAQILDVFSRAVKRQSELILDDIEIYLDRAAAYERYAESLGKSTDELTEQERTLAFTIGAMDAGRQSVEDLGGSVEAATDQWDQLSAATRDYADNVQRAASESQILQGLLGGITTQIEAINRVSEESGVFVTIARILRGELAAVIVEGMGLQQQSEDAANAQRGWNATTERYTALAESQGYAIGEVTAETEALSTAQAELNLLMNTSISDTQERYTASLGRIEERMQRVGAQLEDYRARHGSVISEERDRTEILTDLAFAEEEVRLAQLRLNQAARETPEIDLTPFRDAARAAQSELDRLDSRLRSLGDITFIDQATSSGRLQYYQRQMERELLEEQREGATLRAQETQQALEGAEAQQDAALAREQEIRAQETQLRMEQQLYRAQQRRAELVEELQRPPDLADFTDEIAELEREYQRLQEDYNQTLEDRSLAERQAVFDIMEAYLQMDGELSAEDTGVLWRVAERWGLIDERTVSAWNNVRNYVDFVRQNESYFYRAPFLPEPHGLQMTPATGGGASGTPGVTVYGDLIVQGGDGADILEQVQQSIP